MITELRNKFPVWAKSENLKGENYKLLITDDLDSLMCAAFYRYKFGHEINFFYDFNSNYINNQGEKVDCHDLYSCCDDEDNKVISMDCDFTKGKIWGNHITMLSPADNYNKNAANINVIQKINNQNYYSKWAGSSFISMASYYGVDITKFNDEQRKVLCAIDGLYTAYKVRYKDFRPVQDRFLKMLEFEELSEFMTKEIQKTNSYKSFWDVEQKYNLKSKIWMGIDNRLHTNIKINELSELFGGFDLSLPDKQFDLIKQYDKYSFKNTTNTVKNKEVDGKKMINFVVTRQGQGYFSLR